MRTIRRQLAAVLFAIFTLQTPAWATSFSTDQSDLWYVESESGWGLQLVQRGNVIFATLFVYDTNGTPTWYTPPLMLPLAPSAVSIAAVSKSKVAGGCAAAGAAKGV